MSGPGNEYHRPPFAITPTEQKAWEEWSQASTAADAQQAVQDWARRYKVKLTNQTVSTVTRTGTGGQLSPPVLELTNVAFERTMVNGVLSPLGEVVEPGEPVEAGKCQDHCTTSFETEQKLTTNVGTVSIKLHCTFKKCETKVVSGVQTHFCYYDCSGSATTKA